MSASPPSRPGLDQDIPPIWAAIECFANVVSGVLKRSPLHRSLAHRASSHIDQLSQGTGQGCDRIVEWRQ